MHTQNVTRISFFTIDDTCSFFSAFPTAFCIFVRQSYAQISRVILHSDKVSSATPLLLQGNASEREKLSHGSPADVTCEGPDYARMIRERCAN